MARTLDDAELLRVVDALASGAWVSGSVLAETAGITRQAVSGRLKHLADWGLEIQTRRGLGYRLAQPLQRLDADRIRAALPTQWQERISVSVQARTDSTNARLAASPAADDPQVLLAEVQTGGRGRRGRAWSSPFGANLYLSLAWTFPAWPAQLGSLSLAVGVCCVRALREIGLEGVMLKWPNDLWLNRAKLGGILIEQRGEAGGACRVVIGVGINATMTEAQAGVLDQAWTTLAEGFAAEDRAPPPRDAVAAGLIAALARGLESFAVDGFAPFAVEWNALDLTADRDVKVTGADKTFVGIARGIDRDGALQVETVTGMRLVHAGDVSLRLA